jgi:hypothetical protein
LAHNSGAKHRTAIETEPRQEDVLSIQREERRKSNPEHRAAYAAAQAAPTQHVPRLITSKTVGNQVHGGGSVGQFNSWLAVLITRRVGTMWCAYVFSVIGITSLFGAITNNVFIALVAGGLSSYFLQLVLLPIIIVGQNVISASQDARAEADHITLTTLHSINVRQLKMLEEMDKILVLLQKRIGATATSASHSAPAEGAPPTA